jgi:hypothetical protein
VIRGWGAWTERGFAVSASGLRWQLCIKLRSRGFCGQCDWPNLWIPVSDVHGLEGLERPSRSARISKRNALVFTNLILGW